VGPASLPVFGAKRRKHFGFAETPALQAGATIFFSGTGRRAH